MKMITQNTQLQILFIYLLFCSTTAFAQVGIGNNNPTTALDIQGALSLRDGGTIALSNNNNNDIILPITGGSVYSTYRVIGPTGSFSIGSIVPVTNSNGQIVVIQNTTTQPMTIRHDLGGTANNRIYVPGGQDLTLSGQFSTITLSYSNSQNRWILVSHETNSYGSNINSVKGTTDTSVFASIDSPNTSYALMNGMTITFTPKHSVVYVNFSGSGYISPLINNTTATTNQTSVEFQLRNGATGVGYTNSVGTDYDRYFVNNGNNGTSVLTGWNASFTMFPITVTPGVSTTISVYWKGTTMLGNIYPSATNPIIYCNSSGTLYSHRSLTIID